jgi:uncharacterized protein (TIGR02996 family)
MMPFPVRDNVDFLVYADWLEEHGQQRIADAIRWSVAWPDPPLSMRLLSHRPSRLISRARERSASKPRSSLGSWGWSWAQAGSGLWTLSRLLARSREMAHSWLRSRTRVE